MNMDRILALLEIYSKENNDYYLNIDTGRKIQSENAEKKNYHIIIQQYKLCSDNINNYKSVIKKLEHEGKIPKKSDNIKKKNVAINNKKEKKNVINNKKEKKNVINNKKEKKNIVINNKKEKKNVINNKKEKKNVAINNKKEKKNVINNKKEKKNVAISNIENKIKNPIRKEKIPPMIRHSVYITYMGNVAITKCWCCNDAEIIHMINFHCGHIISEANGGKVSVHNMRPICKSCNSSMGTQNMFEYMRKYYSDNLEIKLRKNKMNGFYMYYSVSLTEKILYDVFYKQYNNWCKLLGINLINKELLGAFLLKENALTLKDNKKYIHPKIL